MTVTLALALIFAPPQGPDSMLVSTAWLADRLGAPNLVLFQIGPEDAYAAAHIPGAQYLSLRDISAPRGSGPSLELPAPRALDDWLEAHGVSDRSRIVLYWSDEWATPTTRAYLTFYWAGLGDRTSILDGGLEAWRAEGWPVTTEVPSVVPGSVTLRPRHDVVVAAAEVDRLRTSPVVAVIDARNERFYLGQDTTIARPGHIPGATSLPFTEIFDEPLRFKSREDLATLFRKAGAQSGTRVITYCHIGQQATSVWFAARLLGYDARLYDGSFNEWTLLEPYPVEGPKGRTP